MPTAIRTARSVGPWALVMALALVPFVAADPQFTDSGTYEISGGDIGAYRDCTATFPTADCVDLGGVAWDACLSGLHGDGIRDVPCHDGSGYDVVGATLTDAALNPAAGYLCFAREAPELSFPTGSEAGRCRHGVTFCGTSPAMAVKVEELNHVMVYADLFPGGTNPPSLDPDCRPATTGTATIFIDYDVCFEPCIPAPGNQPAEDDAFRGYLIVK